MYKYVYLIVFIFVLNGQDFKPRKNMKVMMKWKLTEYLDLNEEQAEKFFPKMNSYEKKRKEINSKIKLLKENIESQVNMNSSNKRKNRTSIEELQILEKGLVDAKSEYFLSIQNVLEPVQVTKLLIFDKKFKKVLKDELKNKKNKRR